MGLHPLCGPEKGEEMETFSREKKVYDDLLKWELEKKAT